MYIVINTNLIDVTDSVKLVLFPVHIDIELANSIQGYLLLFNQDLQGVAHEPFCDLHNHIDPTKNSL